MKIFIAQLNPTIGAIEKNCAAIISAIEDAKLSSCDLIVFPEMAICGYMPEDLLFQKWFVEEIERALQAIVPHTRGVTAIIGTVRKSATDRGKPLRNSAAVIADGELLGFQDKALLPTYDVFDEWRYFEPAKSERIWTLAGKAVGITICEDIWMSASHFYATRYSDDPVSCFEGKQLDLLVNISASPYSLGKIHTRKKLAARVAKRLDCPVLIVNQVGAQDGLIFDGSSLCMAQNLYYQAASFSEERAICTFEKRVQDRFFDPGKELFEALTLGVRDYFTKQGFTKACLGLSGGIDSSVVACIAASALGKQNVLGVLLPSRFTTATSREDAINLAANLGIATKEISIEDPLMAFLNTLEHTAWDVTTENLQSRIRGMILMAISNKEGSLVLNTGNKSEIAVGYTTLYGDSCGSIAVIGDLLKGQVYEVARWINREREIIPQSVLEKEPTAELRPNQKDSDTLPEYPILDVIIDEYIVQEKTAVEIASQHGFDNKLVDEIIRKIHQNEYKRRQLPFSFRVSEKAFSIGRKIPIVHHYQK